MLASDRSRRGGAGYRALRGQPLGHDADELGIELVDQARELRASQIVIGKSRRSRWFEWRHGSIAQEVIRKANIKGQ